MNLIKHKYFRNTWIIQFDENKLIQLLNLLSNFIPLHKISLFSTIFLLLLFK